MVKELRNVLRYRFKYDAYKLNKRGESIDAKYEKLLGTWGGLVSERDTYEFYGGGEDNAGHLRCCGTGVIYMW